VRQATSCIACTSLRFSHSTATTKTRQQMTSMTPLQVLARYFVLDFDSLAGDLDVELRNRHIELDLHDQTIPSRFNETHRKGAIGKEQVDSQGHHQETKQFELYPGSTHQSKSDNTAGY
jgi:hypothetical protein